MKKNLFISLEMCNFALLLTSIAGKNKAPACNGAVQMNDVKKVVKDGTLQMTLLEYYAGCALTGLLADSSVTNMVQAAKFARSAALELIALLQKGEVE